MTKLTNLKMRSVRHVLSIGLGAATLAVVLTYVLGAQVILQTPQAEEGHELFMSIYMPLLQAITGQSMGSQMHSGQASEGESTMQGMSESQMQGGMNQGVIGNNMLGSPAGMAAGGLAAVVIYGTIALTAATYVISWKQRSFVVAGLLAASGIILMILPLANMNFEIPGPIIGVVVGLGILGLGVAKGIRTAGLLARVVEFGGIALVVVLVLLPVTLTIGGIAGSNSAGDQGPGGDSEGNMPPIDGEPGTQAGGQDHTPPPWVPKH
jgi:hypothetical protein